MRTLLPVATNEQIIDLALEILTNDLGLSLDWISSRIALKEFPYSITNSTLTKIRSLKREGNQYREKISEGLNRLNKREKLKQALVEILKKDHSILLKNGLFIKGKEKWGLIEPDIFISSKKRAIVENAKSHSKFIEISLFKHEQIYESFLNAKEVKILHTYLTSSLLFLKKAKEAAALGCKFQILVAEPNSELIRLRAKGLANKRAEDVEQKAIENYKELLETVEDDKFKGKIQFRAYNELPGATFFQVDNDIYVCSQWFGKFSDDGPYLHTKTGNDWANEIIENFNRIWSSLENKEWDIEYNMYVLREKKLIKTCLLMNSFSFEAYLTKTSSGTNFHGPIIKNQGSCINILLHTKAGETPAGWDNRTANLMAPIQREKIKERRLAVALYMVESIEDKMLSNIVILENKNPPALFSTTITEEEKALLAQDYLSINHSKSNDSEIRLDTNISSWEDIKDKVKGK